MRPCPRPRVRSAEPLFPFQEGWVTWCHACNWNVAGNASAERPKTSVGRLVERVSAASGDRLASDLKQRDELAPRLTPGMIAAYATAVGIQLGCEAQITFG